MLKDQANTSAIRSDNLTRPDIVFVKPTRVVNRVFLHCSASDNPLHDDVSVITQWHNERGFDGCGYHYFIQRNGEVQVGRDLEKTPAAQQGHNMGTIAICLHGLTLEKFSQAQFDSCKILCDMIDDAYLHNVTFHGHKEVAKKECPVFDYKTVLKLNKQGFIKRAK